MTNLLLKNVITVTKTMGIIAYYSFELINHSVL